MVQAQEYYKADTTFTRNDLEIMANAKNYNEWLFQQIRPSVIPGNILEIGAGVGNLSQHILDINQGHQTYLLEPNKICLQALSERFSKRKDVTLLEGIFPNIFQNNAENYYGFFNSILMFNVLEHIEHDVDALQMISQLLQPGGRLLIIVPAMPALYGEIDSRLGHYRRYNKATFRQAISTTGMNIVNLRYINIIGALGWYINFVLLKRDAQHSKQVQFFDNVIIPIQSRLEALISPPFGQSLVVVAEKK